MMKRSTIRKKILWIVFAVNLLSTVSFSITLYLKTRDAFLEGVNKRLQSAAHALPLMTPGDYHDRATGPDAIDPDEYGRIHGVLSRYAEHAELAYIYSYMEVDGKFHVATTSNTPEEIAAGDVTGYFYQLKDEDIPPSVRDAWKLEQPRYVFDYVDEWGNFSSIYVPMRTAEGARFLVGADINMETINQQSTNTLVFTVSLGAMVFLLAWLLAYFACSRTLAPIGRLTAYTNELPAQDFQFNDEQRAIISNIAARHQDEVGELAQSFVEMEARLQQYLKNLRETISAKERIEGELSAAHDIQMNLLPKTFPPFPDREEFDLFAILEPAKEVGGDLYDFALVDRDHLYVTVGDVSDKGVPAAMLMTVTKTLLRHAAQTGADPTEILSRVNRELCDENPNMMFVTVFLGILHIPTGDLHYSNAGHNLPLVIRDQGRVDWLELPPGIVLGVQPEAKFQTRTIRLQQGESLIMYTDGVTEAMNREQKIYSNERLHSTIGDIGDRRPQPLTESLMRSVHNYAGGATQSDDITVMTLRFGKI
jgi:sigma-B regulation protein RsbU (phosphoserine phosphatase)